MAPISRDISTKTHPNPADVLSFDTYARKTMASLHVDVEVKLLDTFIHPIRTMLEYNNPDTKIQAFVLLQSLYRRSGIELLDKLAHDYRSWYRERYKEDKGWVA